ncbi:MAG: hypothetical protein ACO1TE_14305 [Prosthecobacter sp.]
MKAAAAFLTLAGTIAAPLPARADEGALEARQIVIRAPELDVAALMVDTGKTEASRIAALWQAVKEGRARVISDLSSAADGGKEVLVRQGQHAWLPTELDQDTDLLQMPPTAHEEYFTGTSLQCRPVVPGAGASQWHGVCIPRGPAMVKWPVSWLNLYVNFKPDPKNRLIRGWLDFHDTFQQETVGAVTLRSARMQILAVMPPADQVGLEPGDRATAGPGRWLDVFLAQVKAAGQQPSAEPEPEPGPDPAPAPNPEPRDPFAPMPHNLRNGIKPLPQGQTNMFYGIGIPAAEAATLLRRRDPAQDAALLEKLVSRVHAGTARMRLCVGSGNDVQLRHSITSARVHQVPSEMPSIPSAWENQPIGTTLEMELNLFEIHQDLAQPGRSEWKLALDDPLAVMWQPRPRFMTLRGETPGMRGTHLLGLLHIPEVMRQPGSGLDLKEPESILVFGQYLGGHAITGNLDEQPAPFEAEVIVLEMPGASVDDFEGLPGDPQPDEEDERFQQLMSRVQTGEVRIAAHAMAATARGRALLRIAELHKTATEFDPPETTPRMRPTALESLHAGTEMEIEANGNSAPPFEIHVNFSFKHSTGLPVEPDLPATLAAAAKNENGPYPESKHPQETWTSSDKHDISGSSGITVQDNKPFCLGARKPPGITRKVIHVAYLRVRRL